MSILFAIRKNWGYNRTKKTYPKRAVLAGSGVSLLLQRMPVVLIVLIPLFNPKLIKDFVIGSFLLFLVCQINDIFKR